MVDQINKAIDVVVSCMDQLHRNENDNNDNEEKLINISSDYETNNRPVYQITRRKYLDHIRQQLQMKNRILLRTLNTYAYYSCERSDIQQKIFEHMTQTDAYHLIMELHERNQHHLENVLKTMNKQIMTKLNHLYHTKLISYLQWQKLINNRLNSRLDILYFLPNICQVRYTTNDLFLNDYVVYFLLIIQCL